MSKPKDNRLHIGVVTLGVEVGQSGGTGVFVESLRLALSRHATRHRYTFFVDRADGRPKPFTLVPHVRVQEVTPQRPWVDIRYNHWKVLKALGRTSLNSHEYLKRALLSATARIAGVDVLYFPATVIARAHRGVCPCTVLTFFDMQQEYFPEFFTPEECRIRSEAHRGSVDAATLIWAPSAYTARTLQERYDCSPERIRTIPVGATVNGPACPVEVEEVRQAYKLPAEYLFYPANPWPHKNFPRLLDAMRLCRERDGREIHLVVTGKLAKDAKGVAEMATERGLADLVHDLGFVSRDLLPELYAGSQALIFPSLFEGFGIPILEAMTLGVPVIASRSTSLTELVEGVGLLVDPLSVEDIAAAMCRISDDAALRERCSSQGLERAQQYTWPRLVPRIEELFAEAHSRSLGSGQ